MKATPYILAAVCAVGAYLVARAVFPGPAAPTPADGGSASTAPGSAQNATTPSWKEPEGASPQIAPPGASPFAIGPAGRPGQKPAATAKTAAYSGSPSKYAANPMAADMSQPSASTHARPAATISPGQQTSETGDAASGAKIDIAASQMLGYLDKAYRGMSSFAADVEFRTSDDPDHPQLVAQLAFRRNPERAVALISAPDTRTVLYDGTNVILYPSPDSSHFTRTANMFRNLKGSGIGTVLGRVADDPQHDILSRLIADDVNSQKWLEPFTSLDDLGTVVADGVPCDRVVATRSTDSVTLLIGHRDHLLRRIMWAQNNGGDYFLEDFRSVRTSQNIPPSLFVFHPPRGITQYAATGQ